MTTNRLIGRIGHHNSAGHLPWLSRDYEQVSCQAVGCLFNREKACGVPSIAKMDETGKCTGFKAKPLPRGLSGD